MLPEEQDLSDLLAKKEQEWRDIQQRQILFLQQNLKEAQKHHREQKDKFDRLKKDFTHNLKVLEERDRELEQHEAVLSRLTVVENAKRSEISDLKVQIEKLQQELLKEKKSYSDLQGQYQRRIKEHQIDLDRVKSSKNSDIDRLLEEYEKVKRQLERKMEEVQGDLTLQKQELSLEFDCELKKREHGFRVRLDEMSTVVLSHELKVKLLTKELEVVRERELVNTQSLQQTESGNQMLQEALRRKDFEMKDLEAVKDARIKELQDKVQSLHHQLKRQEETFQIKHEQLDRCAREKASALRSIKEAHSAQVLELEKQLKELQMCVETLQMERKRAQCSHQTLLEEKDSTIQKLKADVDTLRSGWDSYISQVSKDTVSKDVHIQSLQEEEEKLKAQIIRYQRDIERYQQQLAGSVERERLLEQARVQVELDWQKRCEEAEKVQYQKSEALIENLSKAKDQLEAELKEKDRRLKELQLVVTTVTWERDRAVSALTKQGASNHTGDQIPIFRPDFASSEIQKLQEQNAELRQVIGQMRQEMETLCEQISPAVTEQKEAPSEDKHGTAPSTDYVKSLEEEIRNLKQRIREMEEQLQAAPSLKDTPDLPPPAKPVLPDNVYIQTHIRNLNETIGALRADKVASAAAAKRMETRTAHLDALVAEVTQKVQQKQAEVSQLQFQLNSEARHSQATIASLQQRRTELELQLAEARKEAEEYFKGNLKQNLETVGLGNEVCALKLELASQRAPVVLSESETIKHLREEALSLRQQLSALTASGGVPANAYILRNKLKEAVKKISQLSVEKQQLIDMGNRLRAELASTEANTLQASRQTATSTPPSRLPAAPEPENRLSALESLQYQLTSQELQFAQYQKTPRVPMKDAASMRGKSQQQSDSSGVQSSLSGERKPRQKENLTPSPRMHHVTSARSLHSAASLTEGDASLQDVWKILDMGSSPSLISSQEESRQAVSGKIRQKEEIPGKMASSVRSQPAPRKTPEKSGRSAGHPRSRGTANTSKIRNYNLRD
ncbi:coiled-coil domain-containing protein 57 [Hyperolius riggenbachi]|uniref:coiled-coil domain-containing protein 57 n=1 Tax=Hyperolius riggenbachi TaxID=752182 RepID=UPI0035A2CB6F